MTAREDVLLKALDDVVNASRDAGLSEMCNWMRGRAATGIADARALPKEGRIEELEALAKTMAEELAKWGWGDMHYGSQPQERSVVAALEEYRRVIDGGES